MDHIIKSVLPYKDKIFSEDENFFINDSEVFGELPPEEVAYIREMVGKNGFLSQDEKEGFWNYFKVFIALAENHKKFR